MLKIAEFIEKFNVRTMKAAAYTGAMVVDSAIFTGRRGGKFYAYFDYKGGEYVVENA